MSVYIEQHGESYLLSIDGFKVCFYSLRRAVNYIKRAGYRPVFIPEV